MFGAALLDLNQATVFPEENSFVNPVGDADFSPSHSVSNWTFMEQNWA